MKLTLSVSYAIGVLLQIEQLAGKGQQVTAAKIARGCRFPPRFLYRILRRLVDAGLLRGVSGPGGGYALTKGPGQISLLEIVSAVESSPEATELPAVCRDQRRAIQRVNQICQQNARRFTADLRRVSLADLSRGRQSGSRRKSSKKRASKG